MEEKGWMVDNNGQYEIPGLASAGFTLKVTDKNFYIASSPELLQQYESGAPGKSSLPADIRSKINGKSGAFYIDINQILQAVPASGSEEDMLVLDKSKALFKDIVATFDASKGGESSGQMELRLMNDKENSLSAMLHFVLDIGKYEKSRHHKMDDSPLGDSTSTLPPTPSK
jgi:hypothetical protein